MLTSQDVNTVMTGLSALVARGDITPTTMETITDKLIALIPAEPTTVLKCQKCGRSQGDPANQNCDMQPCTFA
jgi:hypothetical protein